MYDIEKIKSVTVEDVAQKLGIKVGRGHAALCPFHADRVASLHFSKDKRHWKCFACAKGGDQISLVMEYLGMTFTRACEWLEKEMLATDSIQQRYDDINQSERQQREAVVDRDYLEWVVEKPRLTAEARRFLFEERRLDPKVIAQLGITATDKPLPCTRWGRDFYDAPSLLIPYRDTDGQLLTVQERAIEVTLNRPRFRFPPGSPPGMYNKPVLRQLGEGDELWVTEGPSDCWAMMSAGRKAVALPSATLLTMGDVKLLKEGLPKGVTLHMSPDNDRAGMELLHTLKGFFPQLREHMLPEGMKDFGELWRRR